MVIGTQFIYMSCTKCFFWLHHFIYSWELPNGARSTNNTADVDIAPLSVESVAFIFLFFADSLFKTESIHTCNAMWFLWTPLIVFINVKL